MIFYPFIVLKKKSIDISGDDNMMRMEVSCSSETEDENDEQLLECFDCSNSDDEKLFTKKMMWK